MGTARYRFLLVLLGAGSCIYAPELKDCRVRCADDGSCPSGTHCDGVFCRPEAAEGTCDCITGEERSCGGGQGECVRGVQRCGEARSWGPCLGEGKPTPEICDGKDNDCNGEIDENPTDAPPCGKTKGVCQGAVQPCIGGGYPGVCADADYGPDYQPVETRCDGKDNDCDGITDGKSPRHLLDVSSWYDVAGVDGGYVLAWAQTGGSNTVVRARYYDAELNAVGADKQLGTANAAVAMRLASFGRKVWVAWETGSNLASGALIDTDNLSTVTPLPGLPGPSTTTRIALGANAGGAVGVTAVDGGVWVIAWPTDGGSYTTRLLAVPEPGFLRVDSLNISNTGAVLMLSGTRVADPDAGTTASFDMVMSIDGTTSLDKYVYSGATVLDTSPGTQALYTSYCNFLGLCNESYLVSDFDVWNPSSGTLHLRNASDSQAIKGSHFTPLGSDWVASWIESDRLFVGSPLYAAQSVRYRNIDLDGGLAQWTRIANAGGAFSAVAYNSRASSGTIEGLLICAP